LYLTPPPFYRSIRTLPSSLGLGQSTPPLHIVLTTNGSLTELSESPIFILNISDMQTQSVLASSEVRALELLAEMLPQRIPCPMTFADILFGLNKNPMAVRISHNGVIHVLGCFDAHFNDPLIMWTWYGIA
ncbi:MAG: hypothetical protein ACLFV5_09845, partial [Anaerolineales bacterium]